MTKSALLSIIYLISMPLLISGCATSRGVISLNAPLTATSAGSNGKEVYINSVHDARVFETAPKSPDIPSLDPDETQTPDIKLRAVARKRNTYGKGLGDIILSEDQTVESVIMDSLKLAFGENGFKVLDKRNDISDQTYVVDATIDKFWSWMNPGFWALKLSTEISTRVSFKNSSEQKEIVVGANESDNFQTGAGDNWIAVMQKALRSYVLDAKSKLH